MPDNEPRPKSVGAAVADLLREAILTREFVDGERLPELTVCEKYGVSRIPLREAYQILASEGAYCFIREPRGSRPDSHAQGHRPNLSSKATSRDRHSRRVDCRAHGPTCRRSDNWSCWIVMQSARDSEFRVFSVKRVAVFSTVDRIRKVLSAAGAKGIVSSVRYNASDQGQLGQNFRRRSCSFFGLRTTFFGDFGQ